MKLLLSMLLLLTSLSISALDWNEVLMESSENGDLPRIKQALDKGAKINFQSEDKGGSTPLMIVAEKGYLEIVKFLLSKKAKVNLKDSEDYNALMYGVRSGSLEI